MRKEELPSPGTLQKKDLTVSVSPQYAGKQINKIYNTNVVLEAVLLGRLVADFHSIEVENSNQISFRDASHSRCSIPSFLSSIRPCSTKHERPTKIDEK